MTFQIICTAILALIIGVLALVAGYRLFLLLLPIWGFFAGFAMVAQDGSFDSITEVVTGSFLSPLTSGAKNVFVRGTDSGADTGPQSCTTLMVDSQGPVTSFLVASPDPVEPGAQVTVSATVDDTTTGNTNIQSAEYQLDGGSWTPMTAQDGGFDSPGEAVTAQFAAPTQEGTVEICVRGTDALVNLGSTACIQLIVSSTPSPPLPLYLPIMAKNQSNP